MSLRNHVALLVMAFAAAMLAACGDSDNPDNPPLAPPSGAFNNSNLNGTYIVAFSGYDRTNGYDSFFAVAGALTANGSGSFTSGTLDVDDPALGSALRTSYTLSRVASTGNYNITPDGRGSGTITMVINGTQVQLGLDFVLASSAHGLISRFDANGTGSGSIDLQATGVSQGALQGSYAFALSGVDSTIENPLMTVGAFALDANGNITSGLQDFNANGNSTNLQSLALQGLVAVGAPGSTQLTTSAAGYGTLHFDAWVIDATHIKLIETDSTAYLEGDAFVATNSTAFPTGPLVLSLTGEDISQGSFASGGLLTSDGSSAITAGLEDINDEGDVAQVPSVSGSFASSGPRTVLTLNGIYNGGLTNGALSAGNYVFAAYPYDGGAVLMEIDNGAGSTYGIAGGALYVQSATSLADSAGYALNLTGGNGNGEVDMIAELTTNGSDLSGLYDVNNFGFLLSDASLGSGASYSSSSNGRGTAQFPVLQTGSNSVIAGLDLTFYVVDSSTVVFIETDPDQFASGVLLLQNSPATPAAAQARFALPHRDR